MATNTESEPDQTAQRSLVRSFLQTLVHNKLALLGAVILSFITLTAVTVPLIIGYDPQQTNLAIMLQSPSIDHPLGTDRYGRDILVRVIVGARTSLFVASLGVGVATFVGVTLGAISGYYEGVVGESIMRFADMIFSFPALLLALALVAVLGQNQYNVIFAVGIVYWPIFARITRGSVLSVKQEDFVQASQGIGERDYRIIFREILPNVTAPIIVQATISLAVAILLESALSFLGLGVPPPDPSWGRMLAQSRDFMTQAPWWTIAPGMAIVVTVLSLNFVGDALRDTLDPQEEELLDTEQ
jgi:peptide/nickel transport system permease protein